MSLDFLSCVQGFVAIAEYKGFSQAARHLQISTPMLTNQLKRLEESLGKKLLHRTTRYVSLTEAGAIYLIRAQRILAEIEEARCEICHLEVKPHGVLRLGIPSSFNSIVFVKHLISFSEQYPKIQLQVIDETSPTTLLDGSIDLLMSEVDVKEKQLIKDHLLTIHRGIYAAPKYIKKYGVPKNIADLKNHNCLIVKGSSPKDEWILANKRISVSGNYTSSSGMNILYAGMEGLGLLWCTDIALKDEIQKGKLIKVKLKDQPTAIKIYLYYRPAYRGSNVQLMVEHLKQKKITNLWDKT